MEQISPSRSMVKKAIAVDHDVPLPKHFRGPIPKYPWRKMEVGDSFFVPEPQSRVCAAAQSYEKTHGTKYRTAKITENGVYGVRVWRLL